MTLKFEGLKAKRNFHTISNFAHFFQKYESTKLSTVQKFVTLLPIVKSQIFVRDLISYFCTFESSIKFNTVWKFCFGLRTFNISTSVCFEAFESTKTSSNEPVSSQKYEIGSRTKIVTLQHGLSRYTDGHITWKERFRESTWSGTS